MKRGVFDTLRRGVDNTVANWQVSLIRLLEAFVFLAVAAGLVIAILVPVFLSAGIRLADLDKPEDFENVITTLFSKWMILVWIVLGVSALLLLFVIVHSFVEAGCARVFVDADRIAGPAVAGARSRYRVFSLDRWTAGGKAGFWTVFWIYNVVWGIAGLVVLIPLLPTFALIVLFHDQEPVAVLSGCLGLIVTVMLGVIVAVLAGMWTNRAVVSWAAHHTSASESMRIGWRAIKGDFGRHVMTALAVIVVAMAGSMFFASFSMFAGFGEAMGGDVFMIATLPVRLAGSILNSAFSAVLGSWYVATYAALAVER